MHLHFHCCVIDGVFAEDEDEQVRFAWASTLTPDDKAGAQKLARIRMRPSVALSTETRPGHHAPNGSFHASSPSRRMSQSPREVSYANGNRQPAATSRAVVKRTVADFAGATKGTPPIVYASQRL
jgi:hypothetical protein